MNSEKLNGQTMTKDQVPVAEKEWSVKDQKREVSWPSVLFYIHLNILGFYGIMVLFTHTSLLTVGFCKLIAFTL